MGVNPLLLIGGMTEDYSLDSRNCKGLFTCQKKHCYLDPSIGLHFIRITSAREGKGRTSLSNIFRRAYETERGSLERKLPQRGSPKKKDMPFVFLISKCCFTRLLRSEEHTSELQSR